MFEDMMVIWDSKNEEKLYAINENSLYQQIKRKEKSVSRSLQRFEMIMIGVNILVALALITIEFLNGNKLYDYLLPGVYLAYAVLAIVWRQTRRQENLSFEQTMMGILDKAIWQTNYLIKRSRELIRWYLLPLAILIAGKMLYDGQLLSAVAIILLMGGAGVLTERWEIKRKHLPQKQSLESLRATLLTAET